MFARALSTIAIALLTSLASVYGYLKFSAMSYHNDEPLLCDDGGYKACFAVLYKAALCNTKISRNFLISNSQINTYLRAQYKMLSGIFTSPRDYILGLHALTLAHGGEYLGRTYEHDILYGSRSLARVNLGLQYGISPYQFGLITLTHRNHLVVRIEQPPLGEQ